MTGNSVTGAAVALMLGSLELVGGVSTFFCDSLRDSLGVNWGRLGNRTPPGEDTYGGGLVEPPIHGSSSPALSKP